MSVRAVKFVSASARQRVAEQLTDRLADWASQWCIEAESRVELLEVSIPDDTYCTESEWISHGPTMARLHFCHSESLPVFAASLADLPVAEHAVSDTIARAAIRSLSAKVLEETGSALPANDPAPASLPPECFRRDSGNLLASIRLGDNRFRILLEAGLIDTLAPPKPADAIELVRRESGIDSQTVELEVTLDLGGFTLNDLRDLQPGDCITTSTPLDATFDVALPGQRRIAGGRLGQRSGKRAVLLNDETSR